MLNTSDVILVVVDLQGSLFRAMHGVDNLSLALEKIIKGSNVLEIPILWTEQNPKGLGPTLPEFASLMKSEMRSEKLSFSCCGAPDFMRMLNAQDRRQILLTGIESHVCVYQTGMDLLNMEYEVQVVTDAVSSRTLENKLTGIQKLRDSGAKITSAEMALFEMLKAAEGPKFKEILKIVK